MFYKYLALLVTMFSIINPDTKNKYNRLKTKVYAKIASYFYAENLVTNLCDKISRY